MMTYAAPLVAGVAAKNVRSASTPPAEAPMPTTGKGSLARAAKSKGAATSSGLLAAKSDCSPPVLFSVIGYPSLLDSPAGHRAGDAISEPAGRNQGAW